MAADQEYLRLLERDSGAAVAQRKREEYEAARQQIEALPDGPIGLLVRGVELGRHSINFSDMTYGSGTIGPKDPVNVIFYNHGEFAKVYDYMGSQTSSRWRQTACGDTQWVYIWDSSHTGGFDDWRAQNIQLENVEAGLACGAAVRDHLRLFESWVFDSHPGTWGKWSVADAHHDAVGHQCTDDWEGPESRVRASFRDGSGNPLWFVGWIWDLQLGNGGQHQCAYNDGVATVIELLY